MAALSNYLENKLGDFLLRGQPFTPPATVYIALLTAAATDAGGGTEVAGAGYARAAVPCSLTSWSGTQGAGSTTVSTGTSGTHSNNQTISFSTPTANWGTITHIAVYDAPTGGNLLWHCPLTASKTIMVGDPAPSFPATTVTLQLDD